jgi:hypothetical protein
MKFILVPILMLLMLIQTFSKWAVVAEYNLNKNYIAKNLCINKTKPKLHCNGKCQMMKKLAEEEKQNSSNNNSAKIKIQELVFSNEMNRPCLPVIAYTILSYNEEPPLLKQTSPVSSIFHPPSLG